MPRSLLARSLEPLVAILWGLFFASSAWLAVVWLGPVTPTSLGFSLQPGAPPPPNADFRTAFLLFAQNADLIWMSLAVVNLHLLVTKANGLATARAWLAFTAGSAFLLGWLNVTTRIPFGAMAFGEGLGGKVFGVPIGWPLLWAAVVIAARESVLWLRPKLSHAAVSFASALVVFTTIANVEPTARHLRGWWDWFIDIPRNASGVHAWAWVAWFFWPWLVVFCMREKDVVAGAGPRSVRPAIILGMLNFVALVAHYRRG
jgi:hypothetical protein